MRLRTARGAAAAAVLAGSLLTSTAACTGTASCAGLCPGQPYVLQVIFRPGITTQAATATLHKCATGSVVVRIGDLAAAPGSSSSKPSMMAKIFTRAEVRSQIRAVLSCLNHAPIVQEAAFPG
jgi:hypothetical protein